MSWNSLINHLYLLQTWLNRSRKTTVFSVSTSLTYLLIVTCDYQDHHTFNSHMQRQFRINNENNYHGLLSMAHIKLSQLFPFLCLLSSVRVNGATWRLRYWYFSSNLAVSSSFYDMIHFELLAPMRTGKLSTF